MRPDFYLKRRLEKMKKKSRSQQVLLWLGLIFLSFFMLGTVVAIAGFIYLSQSLPTTNEIKNINFTQSTIIMDREKNPLYTVHGEENREIIKLDQISQNMINATIAIEDHDFYHHFGFYPKRIIKAFYNNFINKITNQKRPPEGGSTITQQLAKNTFLTSERSYVRKIKELILAIKIERNFTKDQILEMYLNKIPYGNNAYGLKRAAQIYFNTEPKDLNIAQSAILASLPNAPSRYNPYGEHRYPIVLKEFTDDEIKSRHIKAEADLDLDEFSRGLMGKMTNLTDNYAIYIRGRSDLVLREMANLKLISPSQKTLAWNDLQKIEFQAYRELIKAPHFVLYVKQLLEEKYGKDMVEQGGLRVYTTIDPKLQALAEQIVAEKAASNLTNFNANNASLMSIQPQTGQILALVGGADYYNEDIDGNVNMTIRNRQPGSSFKPLIYAQAFSKGYSPASIVYDVETKFDGGEPPQNYSGRFEGPVTLRHALGFSLNIPAIKVYFVDGEQKAVLPFVKQLGINSLDPNFDYNWPMAIGSGEVTMMDMMQAYSIFANNGIKKDLTPILKVEDSQGQILEEWKPDAQVSQVLDPQVAFLINDVLSDPYQNLGQKVRIEGKTVAAKTGTSNKRLSKDKILPNNTWIFGYTPKVLTGVWAGNTDGQPMKLAADGYDTAAPAWKAFMLEALKEYPNEPFSKPEGIKQFAVSSLSGKLPGPTTPKDAIITDYFASFAVPTEIDDSFKEATIDKTTNELATPFCPPDQLETKVFRIHVDLDPLNERWKKGIRDWALSSPETANALPDLSCHLHSNETAKATPTISIISPQAFDTIGTGFTPVTVAIDAPHGVDRVEYYLDDKLQYTAKDSPYSGKVRYFSGSQTDEHLIQVKVFDSLQYSSSTSLTVRVNDEETSGSDIPADSPDRRLLKDVLNSPLINGN